MATINPKRKYTVTVHPISEGTPYQTTICCGATDTGALVISWAKYRQMKKGCRTTGDIVLMNSRTEEEMRFLVC